MIFNGFLRLIHTMTLVCPIGNSQHWYILSTLSPQKDLPPLLLTFLHWLSASFHFGTKLEHLIGR